MSPPRMVLDTLLADVPAGWRVAEICVGANWVLALVDGEDGARRAGVAAAPLSIHPQSPFQMGCYTPDADAVTVASLLRWDDEASAAVGLATINALLQPDNLSTFDAADWLAEKCANRTVAIFGRFPFIDVEVRPGAKQVWVFEREPQTGEFGADDMARVLPQADVVAITSSSIVNHTIDTILPHLAPNSLVVLLGPSTPLTEKLFTCGIHALFGVQVADLQQAVESVLEGGGFQKMRGLRRVSLIGPMRD
jgi:uncharacterized protein (DUF4213/DUF364 family)